MFDHDKVLIVDDEKEICILLAAIMRQHHMVPSYVHTIADAKQTVESKKPQLLFLDINLPDGSGIELLSDLKKSYPHMKIIVISAFDSLKEKAFDYGAFDFLPKPF